MGLRCNIDRRGKIARLIWGLLLLIAAVAILIAVALPSGSAIAWGAVILCGVGGLFGVFEGLAGWCVVRAMGFKTPT